MRLSWTNGEYSGTSSVVHSDPAGVFERYCQYRYPPLSTFRVAYIWLLSDMVGVEMESVISFRLVDN